MRISRLLLALAITVPAAALADVWQCSSATFSKGQSVRTLDTLQQGEVDGCRTVAGKRVYQVYAFGAGSRDVAEDRLAAVEEFRLQETLSNLPPVSSAVASNR